MVDGDSHRRAGIYIVEFGFTIGVYSDEVNWSHFNFFMSFEPRRLNLTIVEKFDFTNFPECPTNLV